MNNPMFKILVFLILILQIANSYAKPENNRFIIERSTTIAFTDARLIDGTGATAIENQTILIRNGRIIDIGNDGSVNLPIDAKKISLEGKSLLPGWVMNHEHLHYNTRSPLFSNSKVPNFSITSRSAAIQSISYPRLFLAAGVTSARITGSHQPYTDLKIKDAIASGEHVGPDFDLSLHFERIKNLNHVREQVRFWEKQGFTSVKLGEQITPDQAAVAIDEAHKLGLKVTAHLCSTTMREAVDKGIDQIEHGFAALLYDFSPYKEKGKCPDGGFNKVQAPGNIKKHLNISPHSKNVQSIIQHIIDNDVFITSTLPVAFRRPLPHDTLMLLNESGRRDYDHYQTLMQNMFSSDSKENRLSKTVMDLDAAFWKAGGKLTVGADPAGTGVVAGYANLQAIELLVEAGIPPLEAIKIATLNGAQAMGIDKDRGTIEVGKRADLLVITGDPSVNIKDIQNIEIVFKNGIGYDPATLKESAIGTIGGPG